MIKWIVALKYRADQPAESCHRYWTQQHGPMALGLPGLKRYRQSHRVTDADGFGNAPYDGLASLWFEDEAAAKQALASPEMAAVRADAAQFAEPAGARQILAREVVMRDAPEPDDALKLITFNYRKPGLSPQAFQHYWENQHGQLVLRNFAAMGRYVQNHALLSSYDAGAEPDFDGLLEGWLESLEAFHAGEGKPGNDAMRADEANFLDPDRFRYMLVRDKTFR